MADWNFERPNPSKDDNREVDWAPKQIEKLSAAITELKANAFTADGRSRSHRLEQHFNEMQCRVVSVEDVLTGMIREREEQIQSLNAALTLQNRRVASLEAGVATLSHQGNADRDRINQLVETVAGMSPYVELAERVLRLEKGVADHASETVKAVWSATTRQLDEGGEFPPNTDLSKASTVETATERGFEKGRAAAIDEAESRITVAFDKIDLYGRHRSEILSALHGGVETKPNPMSQWNRGYSKGRESTIELVSMAMKRAGCSLAQRESVVRQLRDGA